MTDTTPECVTEALREERRLVVAILDRQPFADLEQRLAGQRADAQALVDQGVSALSLAVAERDALRAQLEALHSEAVRVACDYDARLAEMARARDEAAAERDAATAALNAMPRCGQCHRLGEFRDGVCDSCATSMDGPEMMPTVDG
jgi:hypothetical protein